MARITRRRWAALAIAGIGALAVLAGLRGFGGPTTEAGRAAGNDKADTAGTAAFECPVTKPNGATPPGEKPAEGHHGNGAIWTGLWPRGIVVFEPGGPGSIDPDGALSMKWWFWRSVPGVFTVEGRRLDKPLDAVVTASIPDGYGVTGFQAAGLVFPSEGCWEVTARAGDASLTFVTQAVVPK